eukprot:3240896-Prymnesium_polylepis.2
MRAASRAVRRRRPTRHQRRVARRRRQTGRSCSSRSVSARAELRRDAGGGARVASGCGRRACRESAAAGVVADADDKLSLTRLANLQALAPGRQRAAGEPRERKEGEGGCAVGYKSSVAGVRGQAGSVMPRVDEVQRDEVL